MKVGTEAGRLGTGSTQLTAGRGCTMCTSLTQTHQAITRKEFLSLQWTFWCTMYGWSSSRHAVIHVRTGTMVVASRAMPVRIRHSWNLQHYGVYLDMTVHRLLQNWYWGRKSRVDRRFI